MPLAIAVFLAPQGCADPAPITLPEPTPELLAMGYEDDGDAYKPSEGDCDDSNSEINPGEIETCDGLDNNCDGTIDEGTMTWFYADEDGDGWGDEADALEACEAPDGRVKQAGDCDDRDGEVSPAAAETCDGQDNNCDGAVDEACP